MGHDQSSCRSESNIYNQLRELLSQPVDYSDALDAIATLIRQNRIRESLEKLEAFRQEINDSVTALFQMLTRDNERSHQQEMEIRDLRIQVIESAIRYAQLNDDPDSVAIGQELLSRETALVSGSIAYLDSER
jgi:hypothetical protein